MYVCMYMYVCTCMYVCKYVCMCISLESYIERCPVRRAYVLAVDSNYSYDSHLCVGLH